jgi:hypothetical protein
MWILVVDLQHTLRVVRKKFGFKGEEIRGDWKKIAK